MTAERWIWICRWETFQHYTPERDRPPAWIKDYTKQLDDDRYLSLTDTQRAILHDLRILFAKAHGRVPKDTRKLSHRLAIRVTTPSLEALNHAGLIEFCSRATLERRLEKLYSSPRAPARARRGSSKELPKTLTRRARRSGSGVASDNGPAAGGGKVCPECEVGDGEHAADCSKAMF